MEIDGVNLTKCVDALTKINNDIENLLMVGADSVIVLQSQLERVEIITGILAEVAKSDKTDPSSPPQ